MHNMSELRSEDPIVDDYIRRYPDVESLARVNQRAIVRAAYAQHHWRNEVSPAIRNHAMNIVQDKAAIADKAKLFNDLTPSEMVARRKRLFNHAWKD